MGKIKIVKHAFRKEHGQYILIIDCFLFHQAKVIFYWRSRIELIVKSPTLRTDPKIKDLESKLEESMDKTQNFNKFVENISQYAKMTKLNKYILNQLIDTIYVYEKRYEKDRVIQKIEIHYKFIGNIS